MSFDSLDREIDDLIRVIQDGSAAEQTTEMLLNTNIGSGRLPLVVAAARRSLADVRLLVESGAHLDLMEEDWGNALMEAAAHGRADVVEYLLVQGANIDAQTSTGDTALMIAAGHGQVLVVEKLLAWNADTSIRDARGGNAESSAGEKGHLACETLLAQRRIGDERA